RSALDLVSYRFSIDEISIGGRLDPELPIVVGDANRLEQVIVNLLSNALDALRGVKPPRRLNVDSFIDDTGGRVCVTVTDNGPGIAPEIAQRLFRPFASRKGVRGTGLGLYISRQLVREAQGELDPGEEKPALAERVLFLSGDITHLAGRGLAEVPRDRVLVKPVELAELERRITAFVREKAA